MSLRRLAAAGFALSLGCGQLLGLGNDDDPGPSGGGSDRDAAESEGAKLDGEADGTTTTADPNDAGADADASDAAPRKRVVFVTTGQVLGNFGGLVAGDGLCNAEALDAGLPATFVAWLSIGTGNAPVDAKGRLTGDAGWSLVDGREVFAGPSAITGGSYPKVGISTTARGAPVTGMAWTGTRETGVHYEGSDCNAWTDLAASAVRGDLGATDPSWTAAASDYCNVPRHILCFER